MNVYEAAKDRIRYLLDEFKNVYLSFSGGKDSGVALNMTLDILRAEYPGRKIKVLYIDLEGMYKHTDEFVRSMISHNLDVIDPEWVCLPLKTTNAVSMHDPYWVVWSPDKADKWVRPMPKLPYVINMDNCPWQWYYEGMTFEAFVVAYMKYMADIAPTAAILGIRANESLNRWRAVNRADVARYNSLKYTVRMTDGGYNAYPIYDWHVKDIWTYNGQFNKPYNRLYDMFFLAGVPINKMRVCEPFGDEQKQALNLFKIIEPETWWKVVDRVAGANFGNIYANTKAIGRRQIKLPDGHTWRSYCRFLLRTLPNDTRKEYTRKFIRFILYWRKWGSPLTPDLIGPIKDHEDVLVTNQTSKRGKGDKMVVKFRGIPDTIYGDQSTDMLSWKRMCMAILKNDISCQSLSFSMTKAQKERRDAIIQKYKAIL